MASGSEIRERLRPVVLVVVVLVVVGAAVVDLGTVGASPLDVLFWLVLGPLLISAASQRARSHPLYRPAVYAGFVAVALVQYLDREWALLAVLVSVVGLSGLALELTTRYAGGRPDAGAERGHGDGAERDSDGE